MRFQLAPRPRRDAPGVPLRARALWLVAVTTLSLGCRSDPPAGSPREGTPIADAKGRAAQHAVSEPERVTNSIGLQLIRIPAGTFSMGSLKSDADPREDEMPRHPVRITQPFYLGMYEVTQAEYEQIFPDRKSFFRWPDGGGKDRVAEMETAGFPAELVKWVDAVEFCRLLSDQPKERAAGRVYRLPTEAEWEYACRGGTQTAFHTGDSLDAQRANFVGTAPFGGAPSGPFRNRTTAAGSFPPNAFGLYDMHGNVWEWCSDWYGRDYYSQAPADDPPGPRHGTRKVIRGGDWYSDGRDCRSAFRYAGLPRGTFYATGMRVVMTIQSDPHAPRPQAPQLAPVAPPVVAELAVDAAPADGSNASEDWPRWRGPRGDGSWRGGPLPPRWPEPGLRRLWRQPVGGGYAGVAVAADRVYLMDRQTRPVAIERILCFDARSGARLWEHHYEADYTGIAYDNGPRTTPAVFQSHVYTLGGAGKLHCLDSASGSPVWSRDLVKQDGAAIPAWGFCASPFVWEDLLIVHAGAPQEGCLIALNRLTGTKVWSSLADAAGYATPIIAEAGGTPQLVCWTPSHVRSVDVRTGAALWSVPFAADSGMAIAMPVFQDGLLLVTGYYNGTIALRLGENPREVDVAWSNRRNLRGHMAQPLVRDGFGYLLDRRHGVTCFELATGKKRWDAENRVTAKARNPHATMVWAGRQDRALILNSDGDLILARLNPTGYREQSRTTIIGETWAHPAYADMRVFARSDTELVCFSLTDPAPQSQ